MARLMGIDYGRKRIGLAVTDPLQIIATSLDTVKTHQIFDYLKEYLQSEEVNGFVVGVPHNLDDQDTDATPHAKKFAQNLKKTFPEKFVETIDESFTSKMALQTMIDAGTTKKYRKDKSNTDKVSAVLILQSYLEST